MKLVPSSPNPPWSYRDCPNLDEPSGRPTFDSVAERVGRFHRNGVLGLGSRLLWYMWDRDDFELNEGNLLTRAHAPVIMLMGLMYDDEGQLPTPTECEFRLLCWEFHLVQDYAPLDTPEAREAVATLSTRLESYPQDARVRSIPEHEHGYAWLDLARTRPLNLQLRPFALRGSDPIRAMAIYWKLKDIAADAGLGQRLDHLERVFLRTDGATFVKAALALLGLVSHEPHGELTPGRIDLVKLDGFDPAPYGISVGDHAYLASALEVAPDIINIDKHLPSPPGPVPDFL